MSTTPDNLRLALTALINSENFCYGTRFGNGVEPLITAHVSIGRWHHNELRRIEENQSIGSWYPNELRHWVTFKPNHEEAEHLSCARVQVTVAKAVSASSHSIAATYLPWHDIYVSLWEEHSKVADLFTTAFNEVHRPSPGHWSTLSPKPGDFSHIADYSADVALPIIFPDTCPTTGLKQIVERQIQQAVDERRTAAFIKQRREQEEREREQKEYNDKLEQRQNDERIEKEYKELMERKKKEDQIVVSNMRGTDDAKQLRVRDE